MTTYCYANRAAALPFTGGEGITILKRNVDLPALVATDYYKLANASTPTVPLTSFSGFVQNDILELWEVPAGTMIMDCGVRVTTTEGATAAATIGVNSATQTTQLASDADCFMASVDLNTEATEDEAIVDIDGTVEGFREVYVTAGSIDITFTTNDTYAAAIFDVWALVAGPLW